MERNRKSDKNPSSHSGKIGINVHEPPSASHNHSWSHFIRPRLYHVITAPHLLQYNALTDVTTKDQYLLERQLFLKIGLYKTSTLEF